MTRAEGNPFFVEEILRQLIDEGRLVRETDGWRAAPTIGDVEIPDSVQAVLAARIDLLRPQEKRTLQAAAVVGRVFWPAPVARFLDGSAGQLDSDLRDLEERDLVLSRLTSSVAGQAEYIFKHALVRDVAYESIPRRERAHAHLRGGGMDRGGAGQPPGRGRRASRPPLHRGRACPGLGDGRRRGAGRRPGPHGCGAVRGGARGCQPHRHRSWRGAGAPWAGPGPGTHRARRGPRDPPRPGPVGGSRGRCLRVRTRGGGPADERRAADARGAPGGGADGRGAARHPDPVARPDARASHQGGSGAIP